MLIEGWNLLDALYMTIITLATVGYGEIHQISPVGRIFTMVLIVFGAGLILYVVGNVIQFLVEGRIRLILGRRKLDKKIHGLKNHYIVCGYGRMGRALRRHLVQKRLDFVVIEQNPDRIAAMNEDEALYIAGGATDETNLVKAGIERAKALIAALGTDADNVLLVLLSKSLNPDLYVVARASQNASKKPLYKAGADVVVSPFDVGARRMAHAVLRPGVIRFLELAFADESTDIHIEQIQVGESSRLVGVMLKDSGIRQTLNLIILGIIRADDTLVFNPSADTCIEAGATVIAVGENNSIVKLREILNP
jgi:voltage-gated potassium channel